ncbi:hypothetical protein OH76DRAFT_1417121 [Lentinus brumalis]|uniref:Uncharacterized protein n=1 Tax=Lentinus brumalis TaxID=2498619 RepID=A0A371DGV4_9APHY|nr:hypothetical protein OH76DRAFT_1417121 [Polyporus brumalis]
MTRSLDARSTVYATARRRNTRLPAVLISTLGFLRSCAGIRLLADGNASGRASKVSGVPGKATTSASVASGELLSDSLPMGTAYDLCLFQPMTRELRTSIAPEGPFDRLARMEDVRTIGRKTQQSGDGQVIASIPAKSRETGKRRLCNLPLPCRGEIFCVNILYLRQAASWHGHARYGAVPPRRPGSSRKKAVGDRSYPLIVSCAGTEAAGVKELPDAFDRWHTDKLRTGAEGAAFQAKRSPIPVPVFMRVLVKGSYRSLGLEHGRVFQSQWQVQSVVSNSFESSLLAPTQSTRCKTAPAVLDVHGHQDNLEDLRVPVYPASCLRDRGRDGVIV